MNPRSFAWSIVLFCVVFWAIAFALITVFTGCTEPIDFQIEDAGVETEKPKCVHPTENLGYKAAVREINDTLVKGTGNAIPNICLEDQHGDEVCMEDYMCDGGLLIIHWALNGCTASHNMERDKLELLDNLWIAGYDAHWVAILNEADKYIAMQWAESYGGVMLGDIDGKWSGEFEQDSWDEMIRGWPTISYVDTETMNIVAETWGWPIDPIEEILKLDV